jgi:hypothetical protein
MRGFFAALRMTIIFSDDNRFAFDANLRLREGLFFGEALGHDGGVEAFAQLVGDLVDLVVPVDFDGLVGGVEDDFAVLASGGVGADLFEQFWGELLVEVVGEMT